MSDEHYAHPRLVPLYDLDSGWSEDRDFYVRLIGEAPRSVLDLGCGTGLLAAALAARGHAVVGVDPAAAMLSIARTRPGGARVEWIEARAETLALDRAFDVVVMTGHAFQTLLDDARIHDALATMRRHLAPGGRVAFETRNPAFDWAASWTYRWPLETPDGGVLASRGPAEWAGDLMHFTLRYAFPDEVIAVQSTIRFVSWPRLRRFLDEAGLRPVTLHGDWDGGRFDPDASPEIIVVAERAAA